MFKFVAAALMVMGSVAFANETAPAHDATTAPAATAPAAEAPKTMEKKTMKVEKTEKKMKKTEGHGH